MDAIYNLDQYVQEYNLTEYQRQILLNIILWMYHANNIDRINKYMYEHTEFFEGKYQLDFNEEFHKFFANQVGSTQRKIHKLFDIMPDKIQDAYKKFNKYNTIEGGANGK